MSTRPMFAALLACATVCLLPVAAAAQIPSHHAEQIRKAAKEVKPRVAPKKPRTVLIWNTPPHLMDKDPHKGYCIPYGEEAMKAIGEASGAFKPVVSDDLAVFAPENLKQFDAIVLNNASGAVDHADGRRPGQGTAEEAGRRRRGGRGGAPQELPGFPGKRRRGRVPALRHRRQPRTGPSSRRLFGATFTGHPWTEEVGVTVEEPEHPLVAAFGGKDFRITDEIYEYGPPYDRAKLRVLMSLDPAHDQHGRPLDQPQGQRFRPDLGQALRQGADLQHFVRPHGEPVLEPADAPVLSGRDPVRRPATWTAPIAPRAGRPVRSQRARHAARSGAGAGFRLALRRQDAGRLGRRPHDLVRRGRRDHRPDHGRHQAQGEQLPHLEGPGRELRAAAEVPAGRGQFGDLLPRPETAGRARPKAIRSSAPRPTSTPRAAGPA